MRLLILAVALVSITILAAAQETVVPGRKSADTQTSSSVLNVPLFPTHRDGEEFARPTEHNASTTWQLTPLSSGCYTMRVYKVKRSESVKEPETLTREYSTCEPGFEFQVRTAAATDHSQAK